MCVNTERENIQKTLVVQDVLNEVVHSIISGKMFILLACEILFSLAFYLVSFKWLRTDNKFWPLTPRLVQIDALDF